MPSRLFSGSPINTEIFIDLHLVIKTAIVVITGFKIVYYLLSNAVCSSYNSPVIFLSLSSFSSDPFDFSSSKTG